MDKVYEALLELNKQMLMQNYSGEYGLSFCDSDFEKLLLYFLEKERLVQYSPERSVKDIKEFKFAGPGGYIEVTRKERGG